MGWGPSAPDMSGANEAARSQAAIAKEQWEDYKTTFAPILMDQMQQQIDIGKGQYDLARENQRFQMGLARKYDDRFWGTQVPLEDSIVKDAREFDTPAERERMAGTARADVEQAFSGAAQEMNRDLGRMGLNPADPKYFGMRRTLASDQALATSRAMNKTREAAKQMGWAKKMDAAALGRGLPGFSSGSSQLAMGWGGQGMQAGGLGMNAAMGGLQGMNQSAQGAGGNYAGAGNTYTNIAGIRQRSSAEGSEILGTIAGAGMGRFMSDRRLKTDIEQVGTMRNGLPIYKFRFKSGGPYHTGVMADEVARVMPEAVHRMPSGYFAVDYSMLGEA